ncbi:MAG: hypothetical protein KJ052_13840 [Candidatus Hydrogenedentes bacterium]|nr:hypothetical protein [Candidatus Hydrogenedentota bacterium]
MKPLAEISMKRVLVFCKRDWLHPEAGPVEHYMHEVLRRFAENGHFVSWVCKHERGRGFARYKRPTTQIMDQIQVARLGFPMFYRRMANLLLRRMHTKAVTATRFDVVVDCIEGRPLLDPGLVDTPLLPVVFRLGPRIIGSDEPPGPYIATTGAAADELRRQGVPEQFIVEAPFGVTPCPSEAHTEPSAASRILIVGHDNRHTRKLEVRLARLAQGNVDIELFFPETSANRHDTTNGRGTVGQNLVERCTHAVAACCMQGHEWLIPQISACAIPVVAPATFYGAAFVAHEETGLLHAPGNDKAACEALLRLRADEILRRRLGREGRARMQKRSWDATAWHVLNAIESLASEVPLDNNLGVRE